MEKTVTILFVVSLLCLTGLFVIKEIERRRGHAFLFSIWLSKFDDFLAPKIASFFFFWRGEGKGSLKYYVEVNFQNIKSSVWNFVINLQKKYDSLKKSSRGQYTLKNNGTSSEYLKQISEYKNGNTEGEKPQG